MTVRSKVLSHGPISAVRKNYFRFRSPILEIDRGPPAGHGTANRFEIDQQTTKIWRDEMSGEVRPVLFYHVSTRRILECTIGFEAVVGVREASHEQLGLVGIRLDDLRENPA